MYLHQTLPQVCNCPLLTLYMSCGECVVRSLPKVLVLLSGNRWLWDWILSCVLEVSVSCVLACNCLIPQEQSALGFYFCEFVVAVYLVFFGGGDQVSLYRTLRELTI